MATAVEVAEYFLATNPINSVSNLKLQKLCSYAQAINIAYLGVNLFDNPIEMWSLGPVIREVYNKYKEYDDNPIPCATLKLDLFSMEERLVLAAVNSEYNSIYDAWGLCVQSHRDFPGKRGSNHVLTKEELAEAFANNHVVIRLQNVEGDDREVISKDAMSSEEFFNALES